MTVRRVPVARDDPTGLCTRRVEGSNDLMSMIIIRPSVDNDIENETEEK
jgi:hypothetical protein